MVSEKLRQGCCVADAFHYGVERAHSDWKRFIPDVLVETPVLSGLIGYWKKDSKYAVSRPCSCLSRHLFRTFGPAFRSWERRQFHQDGFWLPYHAPSSRSCAGPVGSTSILKLVVFRVLGPSRPLLQKRKTIWRHTLRRKESELLKMKPLRDFSHSKSSFSIAGS